MLGVTQNYGFHQGFAFCDGPHAREQRRFSVKTLRDITSPSKLAEGLILDEANDLIQNLDETNGKPTNVHQLFHRNAINPLLNALISHRFEPDDPQFARIAHYIARLMDLRLLSSAQLIHITSTTSLCLTVNLR